MDKQSLLDAVPNGIVAVDDGGLITYFNRRAEDLFRMQSIEVLGRGILEVLPNTGGLLLDCLKSGKGVRGRMAVGEKITLVSNVNPVWEDERLVGAISVFEEISEIEKVAKELNVYKEVNRQLDAIFQSSFDGLFITDGSGTIIRCNKSSERLIGHKNEDIVGRNIRDVIGMGYIDKSVTLQVLEKQVSVTILQRLKNGKQIIVTGTPVFNEKGDIDFVVTNERDITALNTMRCELQKYQAMAQSRAVKPAAEGMKTYQRVDIVAKDEKSCQVFETAGIAAKFDSTVLIQGETGCGKGLLAQFIHEQSERKSAPFIKVNCGAIPAALVESELFGYEKGAFTGANASGKAGLFRLAKGGTVFLDEIGEIPPAVQVKFLRVLEDREYLPVGGTRTQEADVRIVAATNAPLERMVEDGRFRSDLYFRLNIVPIRIPPLRERPDDLLPLAWHFLGKFSDRYRCRKRFSPEALDMLQEYSFPGNVRELENLVERLMVLCPEEEIRPEHLPRHVLNGGGMKRTAGTSASGLNLKEAVGRFERELILEAIHRHGSMSKAARALGVNPSTIVRKAKRYLPEDNNAILH